MPRAQTAECVVAIEYHVECEDPATCFGATHAPVLNTHALSQELYDKISEAEYVLVGLLREARKELRDAEETPPL
jgi:hypothetical protein